jgi:regulator of protease activity HflC (stomatin/prohibitin superfamily)
MLSPILLLLILCALCVVTLASVKRIPEGHAYTLRRVGGQVRTVGAGFHLVVPVVERVAHKISLLGNVIEIDHVPGANGLVYFQVLDAIRAEAIIDHVGTLVRDRLPGLLASAPAEDAAARNLHLKSELNRSLRERGLLITRVQLA